MWDERLNKKIAGILTLMADKPALKTASDGRKYFDGGEVIVMTGITRYQFSDGSIALYGTGLDWHLTIKLESGDEINISVPRRDCNICGGIIWLGESECRRCEPDAKQR